MGTPEQSEERKEPQSFGTWLAQRRENNPVIAPLLFLAAVIGAVVAVFGGVVSAVDWYGDTFRWRNQEYDKLHRLRAGFTIDRFEQELGPPDLHAREASAATDERCRGRPRFRSSRPDAPGKHLRGT